jgi:membrane protein DedA with SNARE-associated domain
MSRLMIAVIFLLICSVVIGLLAAGNPAAGTLNLAGQSVALSVGAVLSIGYLVGLFAGTGLFLASERSKQKENKQLQQWQHQDAKLVAEVQTDREKQLEAKIATLEAALQRALKK